MDLIANLQVLIIDDMATVRQALRTMLINLGISQIDLAPSIGEARRKIKGAQYDLVLCDFYLGPGASGQDFLEELRHTGTLPLATCFFMVTAEASYEKVISVAEIAPDDYLLKPFSGGDLVDRIGRALARKRALAGIYQAIEGGELDKAISRGRKLLKTDSPFRLDAARLVAQLLNDQGQVDEAANIYIEVLASKAVPWARLGLATTYAKKGEHEDARAVYQTLLQESPNYVEVYDRLAQQYMEQGEEGKALEIMQRALAITPNNVARLQESGRLAMQLGQFDLAESLLKRAVMRGANSAAFDPKVAYNLLISACRKQHGREAEQYLGMLLSAEGDAIKPWLPLAHACAQLLNNKFSQALDLAKRGVDTSCEGGHNIELALDLLSLLALFPHTQPEIAEWVSKIAERYTASRQLTERLRFSLQDRPDWAELVNQAAQRIQDLANEGMRYVVGRKEVQAAEFLFNAATQTRNPRLIRNAYNAALKGQDKDPAAVAPILAALEGQIAELDSVQAG